MKHTKEDLLREAGKLADIAGWITGETLQNPNGFGVCANDLGKALTLLKEQVQTYNAMVLDNLG